MTDRAPPTTGAVTVPTELPAGGSARLAFIAEAPGESEEAASPPRPLVGPSGKLYSALLNIAELDRRAVLTGNVFTVRIPRNDISRSDWLVSTSNASPAELRLPPIRKGRYLRAELHPHLDRLAAELRAASPNVVVAMGDLALWALCGMTGITEYRGFITPATALHNRVKVLPTFHPAYTFHSPEAFHTIAADFQKAKAESAFPETRWPKRSLIVEPTVEDVESACAELSRCALLAVDIETFPRSRAITHISFASGAELGVCIPFVDLDAPGRSYWRTAAEEKRVMRAVRRLLESDVPKVMQNGLYDARWILEIWGIGVRNYVHDTRLMHHALMPELPKSLSYMASVYTRQFAWKKMRPRDQTEGRRDD